MGVDCTTIPSLSMLSARTTDPEIPPLTPKFGYLGTTFTIGTAAVRLSGSDLKSVVDAAVAAGRDVAGSDVWLDEPVNIYTGIPIAANAQTQAMAMKGILHFCLAEKAGQWLHLWLLQ